MAVERKKYLIVTAGGSGTRMGGATPKQFLELGGVPVLRRTIERFVEAEPSLSIITVLPESHIDMWRRYCIAAGFVCHQRLVGGGFTRFHSVKNALEHIPDGVLVAVHDGVRPFVSTGKIRELFSLAQKYPAVVPVMPVTDTIKRSNPNGFAIETLDRATLWRIQTPQAFSYPLICEAYESLYTTIREYGADEGRITDDAVIVENMTDCHVRIIAGDNRNIKITTPEDMIIAEALLKNAER